MCNFFDLSERLIAQRRHKDPLVWHMMKEKWNSPLIFFWWYKFSEIILLIFACANFQHRLWSTRVESRRSINFHRSDGSLDQYTRKKQDGGDDDDAGILFFGTAKMFVQEQIELFSLSLWGEYVLEINKLRNVTKKKVERILGRKKFVIFPPVPAFRSVSAMENPFHWFFSTFLVTFPSFLIRVRIIRKKYNIFSYVFSLIHPQHMKFCNHEAKKSKNLLTFACFPVCDWLRWIPIEALSTVVTISSRRRMSTSDTNSSWYATRKLKQLHVEATLSRVTVALAD